MRRFLRGRKQAEEGGLLSPTQADSSAMAAKESAKPVETLAEGMEDEVEKVIPDYYETQSLIPDIPAKLQWIEDGEGQVINQHEEFLSLVPSGHFIAPPSKFSKKFDANLKQMQETRKVCSKIGVVKQMQIQTQVRTDLPCRSAAGTKLRPGLSEPVSEVQPHTVPRAGH